MKNGHRKLKVPLRPEVLHITSHKAFLKAMAQVKQQKIVALVFNITGDDPWLDSITKINMAVSSGIYVVDMSEIKSIKPLLMILQDDKIIKTMHNAKTILKFICKHMDFNIHAIECLTKLFDTSIAAHLLQKENENENLSRFLEHYFSLELENNEPLQAFLLLELRKHLRRCIISESMVKVAALEFELVPVMADLELAGMPIDLNKWNSLWKKLRSRREKVARKCSSELGLFSQNTLFGKPYASLDSQQQIKAALNDLGITLPNLNEAVLKNSVHKHPVLADLLTYRNLTKLINSCGDLISEFVHPVTGRIHATYVQIGARTGRMSCRSPNVQQIPRTTTQIRACFCPGEDRKMIIADYSQVELRVAAELSKDPRMISAYKDNQDLHLLTASLLSEVEVEKVTSEQRQAAKAVNFGLLYAMGPKGLASYAKTQYGVDLTIEQAESFRNRFFQSYKGLKKWQDIIKRRVDNYSADVKVKSRLGRVFYSHPSDRLSWYLNAPVQGSAADLMKLALLRVSKALNKNCKAKIVGVIHDEVLIEVLKSEVNIVKDIVVNEMQKAGNDMFSFVPFRVDVLVSDCWGSEE